jgi:hypothetical protein
MLERKTTVQAVVDMENYSGRRLKQGVDWSRLRIPYS